jgi:hypothetical protein
MIHAIGVAHAALRARVKRSKPKPVEVVIRERRRPAPVGQNKPDKRRDEEGRGGTPA